MVEPAGSPRPGPVGRGEGDPRRLDQARLDLQRAAEAFVPRTPREEESRRRFLEELDRLDRPFDRHADPVHVTGSALVVGRRGTVLHRHKRLGRWMQPGGHLDPGETPLDAAVREAREETGLPVERPTGRPDPVHFDVHPAADGHVHLDVRYLLAGPDLDPAPGPDESQDVAWFSLEEARELADEALVDGLDRVASALDSGRTTARRGVPPLA